LHWVFAFAFTFHFTLPTSHFFTVAVVGVAGEGDLLQGNLRGEFVLQAVGLDEDAVVFLFESLHFQGHLKPAGAEGGVGGGEGRGKWEVGSGK